MLLNLFIPLRAIASLLLFLQLFTGLSSTSTVQMPRSLRASTNSPPDRRMVAARSAPNLRARQAGLSSLLRHDHILPFIHESEDDAYGGGAPFAAHVQLQSSMPTMLLEDHDEYLSGVQCSDRSIQLTFYDVAVSSTVWSELDHHIGMLVITSHPGCNPDGERRPFIVSEKRKTDGSILLTIVPTSWKESFHTIDVRFGKHQDIHLERRGMKKRQSLPPSSTLASTIPASSTASGNPSVSFPSAPTSTPTASSVADANLAASWINTAILPPDFPGASLPVPELPAGLTVSCKNCSLQGTIDMSYGELGMSTAINKTSSENTDNTINDAINLAQNGYIELTLNNFAAHIELESTVRPSGQLIEFIAPFPDIGIPGWVIPKIATIGPVLRPQITFGVALLAEFQFTYGFDLVVPNDSKVSIDIMDPMTKSNVTGFQDTNFTALPFQAQLNSVNLNVSMAFNPQVLLTINILDGKGEISAGAFLNLPNLSATIAQVSNVDDKCNPANATGVTSDIENIFDKSLTNIIPTLDFDVGVLAEGQLGVPGFDNLSVGAETEATLFSAPIASLPTACLSFDRSEKTFGPATGSKGSGEESGSSKRAATLGGFFEALLPLVAIMILQEVCGA